MTSKAFLRAHEMANDYVAKKIHPIKNLSFDPVPQENFEDEIASDSEQDQSDSDDSDEDKPIDELYSLKWTRKMDSYIFQFAHEYEIVKPLMNRENRKVYAAIRRSDQLPVVITIAEDVNKVQSQDNIPREVILMSRIKGHKNVANILGWKRISNNVFGILMSHYVECHLKTCYWSMYLRAKYMHGLLSGLAYLHEQQVFHRDIATNNVMWDSLKRTAVIIDFDNSCMLRSQYCTREVGRDDYDAPEKTQTFKELENSQSTEGYTDISDVYSAGVIFWMLLNQSDSPPSPRSLRKWIQKALQRKKFQYHIELDLMLKMLFKDPKYRITASEALLHPFFKSFPADEKYIEVEEQFHKLLNYVESSESEESEESEQEESESEKEEEEESEKEESRDNSSKNESSDDDDEENVYEVKFPDNDLNVSFDVHASAQELNPHLSMFMNSDHDFIESLAYPRVRELPASIQIEEVIEDQEKKQMDEPNFGNLDQLAQLIQDDEEAEIMGLDPLSTAAEKLAQKMNQLNVSQTKKPNLVDQMFARQRRRRLNINKKSVFNIA
jgi:serine/threonine protein kinase